MKYLLFFLMLTISISYAMNENNSMSGDAYCRCLSSDDCWPADKAWKTLDKQTDGALIKPDALLSACQDKHDDPKQCQQVLKNIKNPFYLQSIPEGLQSQGWLNAWHRQSSEYVLEVKNTQDIVSAVNFARNNHLRLVIKGAGHDYLGRSNAGDALMIWTHKMNKIDYHKQFIPQSCSKSESFKAVTVGAGTRWVEVYNTVTTENHQYVQGGGCTTVGAAGGFTQGGGFGSYSKQYGTGAAGVLQAKVVTADGKVLIANQCQNSDLYWALKGGGGSTYGVVVEMTLRVHSLPEHFGILKGQISADTDEDYQRLLKRFLIFYRDNLNNPHWGEQFTLKPDNHINLFMLSQDLSKKQALTIWQPLIAWVHSQKSIHFQYDYLKVPPAKMWDYDYWHQNHPDFVIKNTGKNARHGEYWWAPNQDEVFNYWYTYQSWWLPFDLFNDKHLAETVKAFYQISRLTSMNVQINKGLAGASEKARRLTKQTAMNPAVLNAGALAILSYSTNKPQKHWDDSNQAIKQKINQINKAIGILHQLAPEAGTYVNEADYFQKNWQEVFWGEHYDTLLKIKQKYDPEGLFYCHHCVGSEHWSLEGMCKNLNQ